MLRSLSYVSRATVPFDDDALYALGQEASRLNALDGVSGMLIFNGTRFFQTIEGGAAAIDDLVTRLLRDPRHDSLIVTCDTTVPARQFGSWNMHALRLVAGAMPPPAAAILRHLTAADPHGLFDQA